MIRCELINLIKSIRWRMEDDMQRALSIVGVSPGYVSQARPLKAVPEKDIYKRKTRRFIFHCILQYINVNF